MTHPRSRFLGDQLLRTEACPSKTLEQAVDKKKNVSPLLPPSSHRRSLPFPIEKKKGVQKNSAPIAKKKKSRCFMKKERRNSSCTISRTTGGGKKIIAPRPLVKKNPARCTTRHQRNRKKKRARRDSRGEGNQRVSAYLGKKPALASARTQRKRFAKGPEKTKRAFDRRRDNSRAIPTREKGRLLPYFDVLVVEGKTTA